jgi:hypothetical protein
VAPRFTDDIDVVVEVTTWAEWSRLGERLRSRGFREDRREGAPICRWMLGDLTVDVMPELESILGFTNRWYAMARQESDERELPGRVPVQIVRAPLFLATKVEAFELPNSLPGAPLSRRSLINPAVLPPDRNLFQLKFTSSWPTRTGTRSDGTADGGRGAVARASRAQYRPTPGPERCPRRTGGPKKES